MKTYSQFINEAFDPWADHSHHYKMKRGAPKPTEAHSGQKDSWTGKVSAPKHIHHVFHDGKEIGTITPYSATRDKKKPGSRIVYDRKHVTNFAFHFHPEHKPDHKIEVYTSHKHSSPKEALRYMAREHQQHLHKKNATKNEEYLPEAKNNASTKFRAQMSNLLGSNFKSERETYGHQRWMALKTAGEEKLKDLHSHLTNSGFKLHKKDTTRLPHSSIYLNDKRHEVEVHHSNDHIHAVSYDPK